MKFYYSVMLFMNINDYVYDVVGQSGYIPTYDPTGDVYGEGQQFGCLEPGANLKYRFLVLVTSILTIIHI